MKTGYVYFAIILMQFFVFFNNVSLIFHPANPKVFYLSAAIYLVSIIVLILAVVRGAKAGGGNCFMTLLFMVNLFFFVWYMFAGFLNDFVMDVK